MTPQEVHAALDARRQTLGWPWWRLAVRLDTDGHAFEVMKRGSLSKRLRGRAEEWLGEAS